MFGLRHTLFRLVPSCPLVFIVSLLLMVLAACGEKAKQVVGTNCLNEEAHRCLALFDSQGRMAPEKLPFTGKAPLGAVLILTEAGKGSYSVGRCSATHLVPGIVATAAHCVHEARHAPGTYLFVVYYDRLGQPASRQVSKVVLAGEPFDRDYAFLYLGRESIDWDSWSADKDAFRALSHPVLPEVFSAAIWSLDPVPSELVRARNTGHELGMKVTPRHCKGSQNFPVLGSLSEEKNFIDTENLVKEHFYYFDGCDYSWTEGNSGALITTMPSLAERAVPIPIGIASAIYFWPKNGPKGEAYFSGPAGRRKVSRSTLSSPLFAMGAVFEPRLVTVVQSAPQVPPTGIDASVAALRFDTPE